VASAYRRHLACWRISDPAFLDSVIRGCAFANQRRLAELWSTREVRQGRGPAQGTAWRTVVGNAVLLGSPFPASPPPGYYDALRAERPSRRLVQGLRDFFGGRTRTSRTDRECMFLLWARPGPFGNPASNSHPNGPGSRPRHSACLLATLRLARPQLAADRLGDHSSSSRGEARSRPGARTRPLGLHRPLHGVDLIWSPLPSAPAIDGGQHARLPR